MRCLQIMSSLIYPVWETIHRLLLMFQLNPHHLKKCYRITVKRTERGFANCSSETTLVRVCLCSVFPKFLSLLPSLSGELFDKLTPNQLVKKFSVPDRSTTYFIFTFPVPPPLVVPTREGGGRKSIQITGAQLSGKGAVSGPDYVAYVFVFLGSIITCRL
jgi:hypothetical protein